MPTDASLSRSDVTDVWLPLTLGVAPFGDVRGVHNVYVLARLKDGVTLEQAQSAMTVISKRLEQQYPDDNKGRGALVEPVLDAMVRDARPRLYILSAAVLAVLLIACINVAGLMLARADSRVRELAIRASLGASRGRIVRQLLTESVALAAIGGILGIALAWWATRTFLALAPTLPRADGIGISVPVLLFAARRVDALRDPLRRHSVAAHVRRSAGAGARAGSRGVLRAHAHRGTRRARDRRGCARGRAGHRRGTAAQELLATAGRRRRTATPVERRHVLDDAARGEVSDAVARRVSALAGGDELLRPRCSSE